MSILLVTAHMSYMSIFRLFFQMQDIATFQISDMKQNMDICLLTYALVRFAELSQLQIITGYNIAEHTFQIITQTQSYITQTLAEHTFQIITQTQSFSPPLSLTKSRNIQCFQTGIHI